MSCELQTKRSRPMLRLQREEEEWMFFQAWHVRLRHAMKTLARRERERRERKEADRKRGEEYIQQSYENRLRLAGGGP